MEDLGSINFNKSLCYTKAGCVTMIEMTLLGVFLFLIATVVLYTQHFTRPDQLITEIESYCMDIG